MSDSARRDFLRLAVGRVMAPDFHGLVKRGMDPGEQFGGVLFFAGDHGGAKGFFRAAQAGDDGAVLELFALAVAHPALG